MEQIIGILFGVVAVFLIMAPYLAIPLIFIVTLYNFIKKNRINKINEGTFSEEELKKEKLKLIIFGILLVGMIVFVVYIINTLNSAIMFM